MYKLTEYIGDYPLEGQEYWGQTFDHLNVAQNAGGVKYRETERDEIGDISPDYYVLIESYENGADIGTPVYAFTTFGELKNSTLNDFLFKYEGEYDEANMR